PAVGVRLVIEPPRPSTRAPPSIRPWSSVCSRPERALPRREKLAALLEPLWQVERNVAEVDEEAAEAAAHLDGEPAAADAEDDRVPELELGGRHLAGRQVDELQPAGHEVELGRAGPGVDDDAARAAAGAHALGGYGGAHRAEVAEAVAKPDPFEGQAGPAEAPIARPAANPARADPGLADARRDALDATLRVFGRRRPRGDPGAGIQADGDGLDPPIQHGGE